MNVNVTDDEGVLVRELLRLRDSDTSDVILTESLELTSSVVLRVADLDRESSSVTDGVMLLDSLSSSVLVNEAVRLRVRELVRLMD